MTLAVGVLLSGSGSNLQALIDRMESGVLDVTIRTVISNVPGVGGLQRAAKHGIPAHVLPHQDAPDRESYDRRLIRILRDSGVQAVVLAGFMRLVGPELLAAFPGHVLNIHPALLPSFPGLRAQEQAAAHGVRLAGCTVHFVDEEVDHGPIIIQAAVPALPGEGAKALGMRILALEHRIFPQALQWLSQERKGPTGNALPTCLVFPPLEEGF